MYIGIDIGGTHTRIAGSQSLDGIKLVGKKIISTSKIFEEGIFEIIKTIQGITGNPEGIGIGIAGRTSEEGVFTHSTNLKSWINKPIISRLKDEFDCSAYINNDAVAQSLGEVYFGTKISEGFLYLVWGTGLGGAIVSNVSGDITSTKLDHKYRGKWEEKFGGKNIENRFGRSAKKLDEKEWNIIMADFTDAIQDLSSKLDINTVVIGGGIVENQKKRISKITQKILSPKILLSVLGEDVGIYGGLALIEANAKK